MKSLNRIDHRFLLKVLAIQTESYEDELMLNFILNELKSLSVTVKQDTYGNIYVTKGKADLYPCIVAHIDTVHPIIKDLSLHRTGDTVFAFDIAKRQQTGIGGDDKVGVYMLLQALNDVSVLKAVFYRDEEIGTLGSKHSIEHHKSWYDNCAYILQADRKGNSDLINVMNGTNVCSEEFFGDISKYTSKYGYKKARGVSTDALALARGGIGISCINISCGYYAPHTDEEVVSVTDVNVAYNLMYDIIMRVKSKRYLHTPVAPTYKSTSSSARKPYGYPASAVYTVQQRLFDQQVTTGDLANYATKQEFSKFRHHLTTPSSTKVFQYTGVESLPLIGDPGCPECGEKDSLMYLPYEGRIYCTKHNNYIDDSVSLVFIKFVEVDDKDVTFVFSVYLGGWIFKDNAMWSTKFDAWVPDDLPW